MANKTVLVLLDNMPPYVVLTGAGRLSGYMGELWRILQDSLHFRSQLVRGDFLESQERLKRGRGDVHLQPTVITTEDIDSLDYTSTVASTWYELYIRAPEYRACWSSYLSAWSSQLWFATVATVTLLTASLWAMLNLEPAVHRDTSHGVIIRRRCRIQLRVRRQSTSLGSCFLSVLGSLGYAGLHVVPTCAATRVLVMVILLFCMLMINSYSAVLTSRLAVVDDSLPFSSLEEVASKGTHALCVRNLNFAYLQFKKTESSPELQPRWRRVVEKAPCAEIKRAEDLAAIMCHDSVVVLETPAVMGTILGQAPPCRMAQIKGRYAKANVALQVRKQFPYTKRLNSRIHRMHEVGLLQYLQTQWILQTPPQNDLRQEIQVSLSRVQIILKFYAGALAISLMILGAEILFHRHGRQEAHKWL